MSKNKNKRGSKNDIEAKKGSSYRSPNYDGFVATNQVNACIAALTGKGIDIQGKEKPILSDENAKKVEAKMVALIERFPLQAEELVQS